MLQKIKDSLFNRAFFIGLFFILLGFLLSDYSGKTVNQSLLDQSDFITFVLMAVILAPLLEEFTYRSYFSDKPILFKLALFLLVLSELASIAINMSHSVVAILGIWSIFNYRKKRNDRSLWIAMIMSSLMFAQGHYSVGYSLNSFFDFAYIQLGIGFIFAWIVVNYKLLYSMIAHAVFNSALMFIGFLTIQVILEPRTTIENDHIQVTFTQVPYFGAETSRGEKVSKMLWKVRSASINELKMQITALSNDSTLVKSRTPFKHYNFDIMSMDGQEIKAAEVYQLLQEYEFLYIEED